MKNNLSWLAFLSLIASITLWACTPKTSTSVAATEKKSEVKAEVIDAKKQAEDKMAEAGSMGGDASDDPVKVDKPTMPEEPKVTSPHAKGIPVDKDIRMGYLDNGMKYYIRQNQKPEDRVELRLAVSAGAMQEDDDQQGLAHFVEHMAFNGTKNFEKSELVDYLESVGTKFGPDLNAYTSFDETVYMLQTRTDDEEILNKGLLVMEDWASGLLFDHEEIDKERGVVESEWRTRLSPNQRMSNQYFPVMYQGSRYAKRLPIGKPEIIRNADYEAFKRFYRDWYRPERMALVIVGDVNVDEMEAEVKKRFGKIPASKTLREKRSNEVPDHKETLVSLVTDEEAPFTNIRLMYKHDFEPVLTMAGYRQKIVQRLYNTMLGNRLNEIGQGPNPPFTYAYTGYSRDVGDLSTYESFAMAPEGESFRALETIVKENERVLRHGFQSTELERAKKSVLTGMKKAQKEKDKTDSRRFAMRYVYNFLDNNPIPSIDEEVAFYEQMLPTIKVEEINLLAEKWITDENRVVVITGPEKSKSTIPTESEVKAVFTSIKNQDIEPYVDQVNDDPLIAKELKPVAITAEMTYPEVDVTEMTLANGIRVIYKQTDFKNDEVLMRAYSPGGHSLYPDKDYPQIQFAAQVINESGIGTFDKPQLQKKLTGKVVRVSPYIGEMYEGLRGSASPDDLETLMQLTYLYFTAPRKDEASMKSFITKEKAIYKNLLSQPTYFFFDKTLKIKSKNNIRRGFPDANNMEQMEIDRVFDLYKDRFNDASDFTFIFVGNFDQSNLKELTSTYLGNLPALNRKENWRDLGITYPTGKVNEEFKKGVAPKSQVDLTWHGDFDWTPENRYHFKSMVEVLRIKMRESMREDKGGVYGVRVSSNASQYPNKKYRITVSFNADPPRVQELIETALNDIKEAKANGADEKTLNKVKETQRQSQIKNMKENKYWASSIERYYKNGQRIDNLTMEKVEESIDGLSSDDVKQAAGKFFNMDSMIKIVMNPETQEEN